MENIVIAGEKIADIKNQGQDPVWKRILYKMMDFFEIKAETVWKNEINSSKWKCKKWWYWQ